MKRRAWWLVIFVPAILVAVVYAAIQIDRGFSAATPPSAMEELVARAARNFAIPRGARSLKNPLPATSENLKEAKERFRARCAICHGNDGSGQTEIGKNSYPKVPDLRSERTQKLRDGEIRYIIENGVRLTGMPAWGNPHREDYDDSWKLVLFIRYLRQPTAQESAQAERTAQSAHYTGSQACEKCHADLYAHWKKTPMANVVRDPREHPEAILPDLAS